MLVPLCLAEPNVSLASELRDQHWLSYRERPWPIKVIGKKRGRGQGDRDAYSDAQKIVIGEPILALHTTWSRWWLENGGRGEIHAQIRAKVNPRGP